MLGNAFLAVYEKLFIDLVAFKGVAFDVSLLFFPLFLSFFHLFYFILFYFFSYNFFFLILTSPRAFFCNCTKVKGSFTRQPSLLGC